MADSAPTLPATPTLVTLIYCLRDERVLLLRRRKHPFPGLWTGPGGKVDFGESPVECAVRELREETGLRADDPVLRGIITETSDRPDWQWLIFAYVVRDPAGEITGDDREGILKWWPISERDRIEMPPADRFFFEPVVMGTGRPYEQTFHYDNKLRLLEPR
jgi:8-oxo-dGTP diphosphatase